jgi:phosphopentomutase
MGTKPLKGEQAPIASRLGAIEEALKKEGRRARRYRGPGGGADILVVEEALTIGDNLETDLGDNYNVTAALDLLPFEEVRKIGALVRSLVRSSRVIVFGGEGVGLENLLGAYRSSGAFAGVSAPDSGVYRRGYQVVHLGFGVNPDRQVPSLLARRGIETILIGKVADIVENPHGKSLSGVDTPWALEETRRQLAGLQREDRPGFLCVNVQETDLAGHRQDPALYAERLAAADRGLGELLRQMAPEDILAVTGDHGNDPLIGHPRHTREKTPLLLYGKNLKPGFIGGRETLGDTGAAALDYLAPDSEEGTEAGTSYLGEIYPRRLQGFGKP